MNSCFGAMADLLSIENTSFYLISSQYNTFHFVMHISIIKGIKLGFTNLQTHKDQREIKECLHIQNTKQITIINLFNKLAAVATDASMGLQICGPMPDSFYNGNVHYKMEGILCGYRRVCAQRKITSLLDLLYCNDR